MNTEFFYIYIKKNPKIQEQFWNTGTQSRTTKYKTKASKEAIPVKLILTEEEHLLFGMLLNTWDIQTDIGSALNKLKVTSN